MTSTIIEALSGLGMFLFGMLYMEHALKEAAGLKFKTWVKNSTSTTFKSLLTGAGATAILQSSSVVTLMTLSFMSASLMSLQSGIAVIFGANAGTTATAWIVATLGFKVKIDAFALPLIGAGGLFLVMSDSQKKIASFAKVMIGFGLLFLGLDIMKTAIESFAQTIDLRLFAHYPLITFVGIGFILTALIQSSSAATAIVLSALYAQILNFEQSASMVIGTNIGTTVTAILGSIGGIPDKKRAAVAHFLFNVITAIVAFALLSLLTNFLLNTLHMQNDLTTALALFHTIFNLLGILLLSPLISLFAKVLEKMFKHTAPAPTKYIHLVDTQVLETAFIALKNEISHLFVQTMKFSLLIANIKPNDLLEKNLNATQIIEENQKVIDFDQVKMYDAIKEAEIDIVQFASKLNQQELTEMQSQNIEILLTSVRESVYAAKLLKDIKNNITEFSSNEHQSVLNTYDAIRRNLSYALLIFKHFINQEWPLEKCEEKFAKAALENKNILKKATSLANKEDIKETTIVSLLNTNRTIYIAIESLFEASKAVVLHFSLEDEKALIE